MEDLVEGGDEDDRGLQQIADEETPYFPEDAPRDESGKPIIRP